MLSLHLSPPLGFIQSLYFQLYNSIHQLPCHSRERRRQRTRPPPLSRIHSFSIPNSSISFNNNFPVTLTKERRWQRTISFFTPLHHVSRMDSNYLSRSQENYYTNMKTNERPPPSSPPPHFPCLSVRSFVCRCAYRIMLYNFRRRSKHPSPPPHEYYMSHHCFV